jgi:ABC-2 type transport system permease protein
MNAVVETHVPQRTPVAAPHATHKFKLLLRREFWEHKGGFFWAPLVAGAISLLLTIMAIVVGEVIARKAIADDGNLSIDGEVMVNGLDLGALTGKLDARHMQDLANGIDMSLFMASSWPYIVLAFVVFFYCLGSLYDERKDRSVLFWKSLPVSDSLTVLSKATSALLVAPLIALAVALVTMMGFMLVLSVVVMVHGGNPVTLLWGPGSPMNVVASCLAYVPVYALWALPTVGWLMLCSAWSRSKPFLWAIMVPLFAGILVSWVDLMQVFKLDASWFWSNIVGRMLLGTFPAMDLIYRDGFGQTSGHHNASGLLHDLSASNTLASLATPDIWIGAIAGAAMIYGAIQLRRRRELAD